MNQKKRNNPRVPRNSKKSKFQVKTTLKDDLSNVLKEAIESLDQVAHNSYDECEESQKKMSKMGAEVKQQMILHNRQIKSLNEKVDAMEEAIRKEYKETVDVSLETRKFEVELNEMLKSAASVVG